MVAKLPQTLGSGATLWQNLDHRRTTARGTWERNTVAGRVVRVQVLRSWFVSIIISMIEQITSRGQRKAGRRHALVIVER